MPATINLQPVRMRTESKDTTGRLAFVNDELVAIFVRLDDRIHEGGQLGQWFLEAGFGPCSREGSPCFESLAAASAWIKRRVEAAVRRPSLVLVD